MSMKSVCFIAFVHLASAGRQPDKLGKCKVPSGRLEPEGRFANEPQTSTPSPQTQALFEKEKRWEQKIKHEEKGANWRIGENGTNEQNIKPKENQETNGSRDSANPSASPQPPRIPRPYRSTDHEVSNHSSNSLGEQVSKSKEKSIQHAAVKKLDAQFNTELWRSHPKIARAVKKLGYTQKEPDEEGVDLDGDGHGENLSWNELNAQAQSQWEVLGYNKDMWDDEYAVPAAMDMDWAELDPAQKNAAEGLGYSQEEWDTGDEWFAKGGKNAGKHGEELEWDKLHKVARTHWKTLGYTQKSWDDESKVPDAINKDWAELTPEEQDAAKGLGWTQKAWDDANEWKAKDKSSWGAVFSPFVIFVAMIQAMAVVDS